MLLVDALKIYNITDITSIDKKWLKAKFRALAKENHPDGKNKESNNLIAIVEIKDAYVLLENAINEIDKQRLFIRREERKKKKYLIKDNLLIEILKGKALTFNSGDVIELDNINSKNIFVEFYIRLEYEDNIEIEREIIERDYTDIYNIDLYIYLDDTSKKTVVDLQICDYTRTLEMEFKQSKLKISLDGIQVNLSITKKYKQQKDVIQWQIKRYKNTFMKKEEN